MLFNFSGPVVHLRRGGPRGEVLLSRISVARSFWRRLRGLLGRDSLEAGEGMWLEPCRAVHMIGMRFPIDVVFLDREGRVTSVREAVPPGTLRVADRRARSVLEAPAGWARAKGVEKGTRLYLTTDAVPTRVSG